LIISFK